MYSLDTHINTAVERRAAQMHAVRAFRSCPSFEQAAPSRTGSQGHKSQRVAKVAVTLAAATPIAVALAWVLAR